MLQLLFDEVRMTPLAPGPVLLLRDPESGRQLPIWISAAAGAAILSALEPESMEHPSTHDLLVEALATQSAIVESVVVSSVDDGLYRAVLTINGTAVTCRVSDGIAVALRCGAPILVTAELFAEHGIAPEDEADVEAEEVEQFREFLAHVRADDFDQPST